MDSCPNRMAYWENVWCKSRVWGVWGGCRIPHQCSFPFRSRNSATLSRSRDRWPGCHNLVGELRETTLPAHRRIDLLKRWRFPCTSVAFIPGYSMLHSREIMASACSVETWHAPSFAKPSETQPVSGRRTAQFSSNGAVDRGLSKGETPAEAEGPLPSKWVAGALKFGSGSPPKSWLMSPERDAHLTHSPARPECLAGLTCDMRMGYCSGSLSPSP